MLVNCNLYVNFIIFLLFTSLWEIVSQEVILENSAKSLPDENELFHIFSDFIKVYNKNYTSIPDLSLRFEVFKQNYILIKNSQNNKQYSYSFSIDSSNLNNLTNNPAFARYESGDGPNQLHSSSSNMTLGVTQFFDYTETEFRNKFLNEIPLEDLFEAKKYNSLVEQLENATETKVEILFSSDKSTSNKQDGSHINEIINKNNQANLNDLNKTKAELPSKRFLQDSLNVLNGKNIISSAGNNIGSSYTNGNNILENPSNATSSSISTKSPNLKVNKIAIPRNFDWRELGAVTPVKEQGICGCCWAFSAIGNIEGQFFLKYKQLMDLSVQQLLNCDSINMGCKGGIMHKAFNYLHSSQKGIGQSSEFPYKKFKEQCLDSSNPIVKVKGFEFAGSQDEDRIAAFLYSKGPLSAALNGDKLYFYKSGILDLTEQECPKLGINHSVLITGYGEENGIKFWNVKNTWGEKWGEQGYFRIKRGKGTCGINQYIVTAVIE